MGISRNFGGDRGTSGDLGELWGTSGRLGVTSGELGGVRETSGEVRGDLGTLRELWEPRASRGLLLNRSPKFSRDFGFYGFAAEHNGFTIYIHPNPNPKLNHNPKAIHNPNHNPNPNPSPKPSNSCLTSLSRDQNSFLPITLQGSILPYVMGGDSQSAFKNTPV